MNAQEKKILTALVVILALSAGFRYFRYQRLKAESEAFLNHRDSLFYMHLREADSLFKALKNNAVNGKTNVFTGKIDINVASAEQITALPGIGPALAKRIIGYRKSNGGFTAPEELMQVKGIGSKKFEKLRPYISVGSAGK